VDVLLFGAHPDDVEWGAGGICLILKQNAVSFVIVDLTEGEMGSRGTVAERRLEAEEAGRFAGAHHRENLNLPDCGLVDSPETRRTIASAIRRYRPALVLAPFWKDRHPDHEATGQAVRHAALYATLTKLDDPNPPHKPAGYLYYLLHQFQRPSFVTDISAVYERKLDLLRIHKTQFAKTAQELGLLPQGSGNYLYGLESRDRYFGSLVGVQHGEALIIDKPLRLSGAETILSLLK
jgi:bacillithiol biosynthesis deacetylase BshB1